MLRIIIRDRCKFANIININICKLDKSYHLTLFSEILKENTQDFDSVIHYCVPLEKYFQNEIYMYKVFALLDMFVDCFISISIYPREHLGAYTWYCVSAAGDILSKEEFATVHRVWHVKNNFRAPPCKKRLPVSCCKTQLPGPLRCILHSWVKVFFWTNTENFLLSNVGNNMLPVRVVKRTETARGFWCIYRD
jgi:hypothetical protein